MSDEVLISEIQARLMALENNVQTMRDLIQQQTQVIGVALQHVRGSGATVPDPHPEDRR